MFFIRFIVAICFAGQLPAGSTEDAVDFEAQIRPLLIQHCAKCHGATTQKGGLRLDAKHAAFKGSDSGPVIVPGKADHSELMRRITSDVQEERMPPGVGKQLTAQQIELMKQWIDQGAKWSAHSRTICSMVPSWQFFSFITL